MGVSSATLSSYPHPFDRLACFPRRSSLVHRSIQSPGRFASGGFPRLFSPCLLLFRRSTIVQEPTNFCFCAEPYIREIIIERRIIRAGLLVPFFWLIRRVAHFRYGHMCTSCREVSSPREYSRHRSLRICRTSSVCSTTNSNRG